jgi:hypothetical protein
MVLPNDDALDLIQHPLHQLTGFLGIRFSHRSPFPAVVMKKFVWLRQRIFSNYSAQK